MVRRFDSAGSRVCPSGSAFSGAAQPGCIRDRLWRGRNSTHGVRTRQTTTLPDVFESVSPEPLAPKNGAIRWARS